MSLNEWGTHTRVQPVHRERQNADRNKKRRQKDKMQPENDEVTKGQKWKWVWKVKSVWNAEQCKCILVLPMRCCPLFIGCIELQLGAKKAGQMGNARDKLIHRISGSLWPTGAHLIWHQCDTIFSVCGPQPGFWLSSHPLPIQSATKIQFMLEYTNTFKKYTNTMWYNI